jgi:hypothetical protein
MKELEVQKDFNDVRFVSEILTGTVLHGYLVSFLFYLMIVNGSNNIDWVQNDEFETQ